MEELKQFETILKQTIETILFPQDMIQDIYIYIYISYIGI